MFKEQELNTYRSICAPEELYEKVMAAKKPQRPWQRYATGLVAACLVLALGAGFFFRGGSPDIIVNGQPLESSVVYYDLSTTAEMRTSPVVTVPVELELTRNAQITVTEGQLSLDGKSSGKTLSASASVTLLWEIPREEETLSCEMHIDDGKAVTILTLTYEESKITITKKGE